MDNKQQMEIIKWAIANNYKGSVTKLIQQKMQEQQQQQPQQMQEGGVKVANTSEEQEQGLRNEPEGTSMMFPDSTATEFNTVGMDYPIDIKKYDRGGNLVKSYESVPPGVGSLPMGPNPGTVLETPAKYQEAGFKAEPFAARSDATSVSNTIIPEMFIPQSESEMIQGMNESFDRGTIKPTDTSLGNKIYQSIKDLEHFSLAPGGKSEVVSEDNISAMSFAPISGEIIDAKNTISDLSKGDYGGAFLNAAGFAIPFIPGKLVKQAATSITKPIKKQVENFKGLFTKGGKETTSEIINAPNPTYTIHNHTPDAPITNAADHYTLTQNVISDFQGQTVRNLNNPNVTEVKNISGKDITPLGDVGELGGKGKSGRHLINVDIGNGQQVTMYRSTSLANKPLTDPITGRVGSSQGFYSPFMGTADIDIPNSELWEGNYGWQVKGKDWDKGYGSKWVEGLGHHLKSMDLNETAEQMNKIVDGGGINPTFFYKKGGPKGKKSSDKYGATYEKDSDLNFTTGLDETYNISPRIINDTYDLVKKKKVPNAAFSKLVGYEFFKDNVRKNNLDVQEKLQGYSPGRRELMTALNTVIPASENLNDEEYAGLRNELLGIYDTYKDFDSLSDIPAAYRAVKNQDLSAIKPYREKMGLSKQQLLDLVQVPEDAGKIKRKAINFVKSEMAKKEFQDGGFNISRDKSVNKAFKVAAGTFLGSAGTRWIAPQIQNKRADKKAYKDYIAFSDANRSGRHDTYEDYCLSGDCPDVPTNAHTYEYWKNHNNMPFQNTFRRKHGYQKSGVGKEALGPAIVQGGKDALTAGLLTYGADKLLDKTRWGRKFKKNFNLKLGLYQKGGFDQAKDLFKSLNYKKAIKATLNPSNWFDGENDFYKELAPQNLRMFTNRMSGNSEEITEDFFTEDELNTMRTLLKNRRGTEDFTLTDPDFEGEVFNKPSKDMMHYTDYHKDEGAYKVQQSTMADKLSDPELQVSTSFGTSKVTEDEDYYYLNDTYDFSYDEEMYNKYKDSQYSDPYNYFRWVTAPKIAGDEKAQEKLKNESEIQKINIKIPKKKTK